MSSGVRRGRGGRLSGSWGADVVVARGRPAKKPANVDGLGRVRAGHPPPVVRHPSGRLSVLDHVVSPPIGVIAGRPVPTATNALARGAALVSFTDGLVETRTRPLTDGLEQLTGAIRAVTSGAAAEMRDAVLRAMVPMSQQTTPASWSWCRPTRARCGAERVEGRRSRGPRQSVQQRAHRRPDGPPPVDRIRRRRRDGRLACRPVDARSPDVWWLTGGDTSRTTRSPTSRSSFPSWSRTRYDTANRRLLSGYAHARSQWTSACSTTTLRYRRPPRPYPDPLPRRAVVCSWSIPSASPWESIRRRGVEARMRAAVSTLG